jgi:hypothetical protein
MGNNNLSDSEKILVKVDQNNLMYIDPNSVVVNGDIEPRGIKQENLVMFVNLEADMVPRSTLVSDGNVNTLRNVAKGTLNFLSSATGDGNYTSGWSESFVPKTSEGDNNERVLNADQFYDSSGESFGIDSISILVKGANFIPQVNINFIDVRGKTLFESPENSPYHAFFHLPWPIFYLTVKGFYGKAIRYRLHLIKFNSKYNETNGNFEISTSFVGSSFAFMNDIPLRGMIAAPYMFLKESTKSAEFNNGTGRLTQQVEKSSKGYAILSSVYSEMKRKKLIPQDFPIRTISEVAEIAKSLDKILEQKIFNEVVDMRVLAGLQDYEKTLTNFEKSINNWININIDKTTLSPKLIGKDENGVEVFVNYYKLSGPNKSDKKMVVGKDDSKTLEGIITLHTNELKKSSLFNNDLQKNGEKKLKVNISFLSKALSNVGNYHEENANKEVVVAVDKLKEDLSDVRGTFFEQKLKVEKEVEREMNTIVKDPTLGIGFEPTVRNLFAILLANAEVYVRLMQEVHTDAFNVANERKIKIENFDKESKGDTVYPWPEIKKTTPTDKKQVIAYPGDPELRGKLQSGDPILWPEVAFVEEYITRSIGGTGSNSGYEGGQDNINYIFEKDLDKSKINQVSSLFEITDNIPYSDRTIISFLYELQERAKILTLVDSFSNAAIRELVNIEFETIKEVTSDESDLIDTLKTSIKSFTELDEKLKKLSPFERAQYYRDSIPTQNYLKDLLDKPFSMSQYNNIVSTSIPKNDGLYNKFNDELLNYTPESYRKNIYPFNSTTYNTYLNEKISDNDFKFKGLLSVRSDKGFITSTISPFSWVKSPYSENTNNNNLFTQDISVTSDNQNILNTNENILNTPYFHKQLFSEFTKTNPNSKYVGSAYLLLNSLPFVELTDKIKFTKTDSKEITNENTYFEPIRVSSLFREISSTHFIPYHLIVKWGSIYHRYKRKVIDNVDILDGFLDLSGKTTNINSNLFFNGGNTGTTFSMYPNEFAPTGLIPTPTGATYSGLIDVGIHPYYDGIFHQVVNGYAHYNVLSGGSGYFGNVLNQTIRTRGTLRENGLKYWTSFVDNSKFDSKDLRYTLLPCDGDNVNINKRETVTGEKETNVDTFDRGNQIYYRTIWTDKYINDDYSGKTFFTHNEYNTNLNNEYSLDGDIKKVFDLIATFSPSILEEFEDIFLQFATEKLNEEIPYKRFQNVKYDNFQDLLKGLLTVNKETSDEGITFEELVLLLKNRQIENKVKITKEILDYPNLIEFKLGNPKELDPYILEGFVGISGNSLSYNAFNPTTQLVNTKFIDLYLGEDMDGYYLNFFRVNNVELSEENVLRFRPLILIYAGYRQNGGVDVSATFKEYITNSILISLPTVSAGGGLIPNTSSILGANSRYQLYLSLLIGKFGSLENKKELSTINFIDGYNDKTMKIELYNFFKSFNDKWSSGNSIGQRLLMEEFLFLDKANKDIGDKVYINLDRFISIADPKNGKGSLYSAISMLIQGTGFDMRSLPAYVNFYGNNLRTSSKITPSDKVAGNLFGTFLEVDYQESSPKTIIQFVGPSSKHPSDMGKKYKFNDDSFNISNVNNNPLIVTSPQIFDTENLSKSNKVVAFEVSFGDQNQSIFKGVSLDQSTIKNTSESFMVLENLGRAESGAGSTSVDVSLFEYYRQASYSCEVTCMGNVMIQPTMFFYLKNIPLFRGSYWITEVSHNIKNNSISTTFKGTRIPQVNLPDPEDTFVSSYKSLFDGLVNKAKINTQPNTSGTPSTEQTLSIQGKGNFVIDGGPKRIPGEQVIEESGVTSFGIPYNGFKGEKYIQKIKYNGDAVWFRAVVARMGSDKYKIGETTHMNIVSRFSNQTVLDKNGKGGLTWGELSKYSKTQHFYSARFDIGSVSPNKIGTGTTRFFNPDNKKEITISPSYSLDRSIPNSTFKAQGPVNVGPNVNGYGVGMSELLMNTLGLHEGDVIYFTIN